MELLIARNPDPDSRLPYLLLLPLAGGMLFRASGTWPRTSAVYCYPVSADEWPDDPDIVDRAGVRDGLVPPDLVEQLFARDRLLAMGNQIAEQLELPRGEIDGLSSLRDFLAAQVDS